MALFRKGAARRMLVRRNTVIMGTQSVILKSFFDKAHQLNL